MNTTPNKKQTKNNSNHTYDATHDCQEEDAAEETEGDAAAA